MSDPTADASPFARVDLAPTPADERGGAGVIVRGRALLGQLNLRGNAQDPGFAAAVRGAVGVDVPIAPNTVKEAPGNIVYWLGPDEWLVVTEGARTAVVERDLRAALAGLHFAVTDVSGGQAVVELRGRNVRDVLAKGCPLDLHPRVFGVGQCAQSHLAKGQILIRQLDREPAFEIIVRRSFADYLWLWLEDAAAEYGLENHG